MQKYFPVLLSKAGELSALRHLTSETKEGVSPIVEVLGGNLDAVETHLLTQWFFAGNQVLLDFSLFGEPNFRELKRFFDNLFARGINAVPIIQQNSNPRYLDLIRDLVVHNQCKVCIRTSNSSGGFTNYNTTVASLMRNAGVTEPATLLLVDLGLAQENNYNLLAAFAINLITSIANRDQWASIIVASGSFPEDLGHLVPAGRLYRLRRYEWDIWREITANTVTANLVDYSDYGTKHPYFTEMNFQGSCSIKYTTENEYAIYRGELSQNHRDGNGQYITFAGRLISTSDYSGAGFSWGDDEINRIAHEIMTNPKKRPGSATTWVEISQNHHITFLNSLL